jgi:transcriptional regulator with XRE-family HTH domain
MDDRESTLRSRVLGAQLRRIREQTGHTMTEITHALKWSISRLSRLESGKRGTPIIELATLLGLYGVSGQHRDQLLELSRNAWSTTWAQSHHSQLPDDLEPVQLAESTADAIVGYHPWAIPALLQTADHTRALLRGHASDAVDRWVRARSARQQLIRTTPQLTFYIPEAVLHTPIGGPKVINDQLMHLALVAGDHRCAIHITPDRSTGDPVELITYTDCPPVAYIETATTSLFLEDPPSIHIYRTFLEHLADTALDRHTSRDLILTLADKYEPGTQRAS